ncbi:MAG: PAS domain-containing protein [Calditrichaeota bacterium]|nr:MAG: PAS domain-containing protein [Calditrichota bacterium]
MALTNSLTHDILNSLGEGVFTVDKNFRITFLNQAAEKITGLQKEEVLGKFCKHVFSSDRCTDACPIVKVLETGKNLFEQEATILHKNGHRLKIRLNASILHNHETRAPLGGIISFREISSLEEMVRNIERTAHFYGVVGHSKAMREIFQLIEEVSDSDASVFIQGESGTGKEMIADAIQKTSLRKDKPYIKVNCSVFPDQLLASELFGHVKGAFTGAIKDRIGRFEMANHGTLFLDEVAEMPLHTQIQLLRVLQEGTFERVGESITRRTDVRIIAATNHNIEEAIETGKFREDLYYRLNVIPIEIPPLRERPEDIPFLIEHFLNKFSTTYKKDIHEIEDAAMELLLCYSWPGNIRELENAIEYAFARCKENIIRLPLLPPKIRKEAHRFPAPLPSTHEPLQESEYIRLRRVLEKHQWNRSRAAQELGMGRTTLWRKLKAYGLVNPRKEEK